MPYLGICVKQATCGICKKALKKGDRCFHDPSKSETNSLAHEKCWTDLRLSRGNAIVKRGKKKSDVPLDPPF